MTKRKSSAPNQVALIEWINGQIEHSGFEFLSDAEKVGKTVLLEGEWNFRVAKFLDEHMPNDKLTQDYTRAVLARMYRVHLPKAVYDKETQVLIEPAAPKVPKDVMVAKLRKLIRR